ncbi:MAG: 4'-phosphopantetheinyl transferase [Oscillospiraceae bacterium]|nr:4'-phosphopantetheinyl transferase [Oscillospiraceae bacterium]
MDIQLYAAKLERPLTDEETETFLRIMPPERRERLLRVPKEELRHEPLCAYAILYMVMRTVYGWKKLPPMRYNKYGKPEFEGYPDVQFNISHTHRAVLVGVHNEPIGVDIEKIRPVSERTMERIAGTTSRKEFFESWVRRESRSKWNGAGLGSIRENENPAMLGERIVPVDTFPDYVACVCTHSSARLAPVRTFTID